MQLHLVVALLAFFGFAVNRVDADFFVILLKGSKILTSFGEFTFFHTLTNVPVNKGTLSIHEIELVVKTSPGLSNGSGVAQHAHCALNLSEITTWNNGRRLVVDTNLETSWAPVDELDSALGLDGGNGSVDILGDNITTVKHAAGHVLTMARITLNHLVGRLKACVGDLSNRELFVVSLLSRDNWGVGHEREVNTGVRYQVRLELSKINIEGTIETKRRSDGRHNLTDETVKVGVSRAFNVEVTTAHIVESLVVNHEGTVGVLKGGVGGKNGVVRLNNSGGHLRGRVHSEFELGLLAIVYRETLHEKRGETRSCTTTKGVEEEEPLETGTLVRKFAGTVKNEVNNLLTDGVVTTGVVVGGILLTGNELLRVEELTVGSCADFINHSWLQINEDAPRNVLTSTSLREECVEGIVTTSNGFV